MIITSLILFIVAIGIFFLLSGKTLKVRLGWALVFLVLSTGAFTTYILIIGDSPAEDSVIINKDAMKREGMTKEEWQSYVDKQRKSK
jgi:hypothetical protein